MNSRPELAIELHGVTKRYGDRETAVVENLDLGFPVGEIVTLVGPSGCGKTTTLKMINHLIEPSSGEIRISGLDPRLSANELRRHIGYVIQQVGLFPHMTIRENVGVVPGILGWSKQRIDARVDELLHVVGLDPAVFSRRKPSQLSGGQQQRVGVARALAADPPILLMDEPFGATDPQVRESLQNQLLRIQSTVQKTVVIVTHDIDEALKLGDRVVVFGQRARVLQYGTPDELLRAPASEAVREFIGGGATYRRLTLRRAGDVVLEQVSSGTRPPSRVDSPYLVVDEHGAPLRWATSQGSRPYSAVHAEEPLAAAADLLLGDASLPVLVLFDGRVGGAVGLETVHAATRDEQTGEAG